MANTKSAIKRIRRISKQTKVNKARKSRYKNALKKMNLLIESKKKTDAIKVFRDALFETRDFGFKNAYDAQWSLGNSVRQTFKEIGIKSVAAEGFEAPGVVVSYTDSPDIQSGLSFKKLGFQIAAGVPLECDEPADFRTFRIGLFGLDKLKNIDRTLSSLNAAVSEVVKG